MKEYFDTYKRTYYFITGDKISVPLFGVNAGHSVNSINDMITKHYTNIHKSTSKNFT